MPTLAVIATSLQGTGDRPYTLTIGGTDVLGLGGSSYGVDFESINVEEVAGGGSGMRFTIWDPNREVTVSEAAVVEFYDVTNSRPIFGGFVQAWSQSGVIGRTIEVECAGFDVLLRWMVMPSLTIPAGTRTNAAIQSACANAFGVGFPLRAFSEAGPLPGHLGGFSGTQAEPIAALANTVNTFDTSVDVSLNGETLGQAIQRIIEVSIGDESALFGATYLVPTFDVDMQAGVRVYADTRTPTDYADLTVTDGPTGTAATVLNHETDAFVPRSVYVKGGNEAGTGLVPDGSGIPGETAIIEDLSITTATAKVLAAVNHLEYNRTAATGTLVIEGWVPTGNIRPGSWVTITNTAAGLTAANFRILSISKRWHKADPVRETWTIRYGGQLRSVSRTISSVSRKIVR